MSKHAARPVGVSAQIAAVPSVVLIFIADTRNDPLWCPNVETVEIVEGDDVAIGTQFRFHQHLDRPGGKRVQFDVDTEIIGLDERSVRWLVTDRFQEREIEMTVEPSGNGTRVTQTTRASFHKPPGLAKWAYPYLARRVLKDQLKLLADHFEE